MVAFVIPAIVNPKAVVLSGQLQPLTASGDIDRMGAVPRKDRRDPAIQLRMESVFRAVQTALIRKAPSGTQKSCLPVGGIVFPLHAQILPDIRQCEVGRGDQERPRNHVDRFSKELPQPAFYQVLFDDLKQVDVPARQFVDAQIHRCSKSGSSQGSDRFFHPLIICIEKLFDFFCSGSS